jgi:predicted Zn-ribbon and HTH transcriptional regulator
MDAMLFSKETQRNRDTKWTPCPKSSEDRLRMLTLRKKIAEVLEEECLDLREISKLFGIQEREVLDHLRHIARSVHPKRLIVDAACCKHCGFTFKKRTRLNTPGRCPVCKSESISPPRFKINPSS